MLAVLGDSRTCMEGLRCILQDIAAGTIPTSVRPHITATRLIALAKPIGTARPIAMAELFYRIAAVRAVRSVAEKAGTLLAPRQYGIGVPGGCEHIVHCMQHSLTTTTDGKQLAAIKVDIQNAFNTCQRPRLLASLLNTPQLADIHRIAHWAYSQPTLLISQRKGGADTASFVQSANGVRQGDPLSSLLFCLYMKPAIDQLVANDDFGSRITVYAYVDDVHIVGELDDVLAAHTAFTQHLHDIELTVNRAKCSLLYFHHTTHPLTTEQLRSVRAAGLQWDDQQSSAAEVLGAVLGSDAAAMARWLERKHDGAAGMFGTFFKRVRSGLFTVQAAMLLLAHSVGRLSYLMRCLPPAALADITSTWDAMLVSAAARVLDLSPLEATNNLVVEALQRPRKLGGFGLTCTTDHSPFAFLASVAASAGQPGNHPLSAGPLPADSLLHQWLDTALTSPTVDHLLRTTTVGDALHSDAATFTSHYHARPQQAVGLQSKLSSAATNSSYNARLSVVKAAGDLRGQARMVSAKTPCASRWKIVRPTESAYVLADEFYRYSARRDLALPPVRHTVLPRQCSSCHGPMAADGLHAQRCIRNSAITILRHNTIEKLLHDVVRDGVGDARRQQPNLPSAERTVPDLLLELDGKILLCDVTVVDPLATSHIKDAAEKPGRVAEKAAAGKVRKYQACADAMHAQHLPFAVEATDGLGESALQLITAIHNSAEQHCTWRDAKSIGTHLADSVAIAVQRCCGMALRASLARENEAAVGRAE